MDPTMRKKIGLNTTLVYSDIHSSTVKHRKNLSLLCPSVVKTCNKYIFPQIRITKARRAFIQLNKILSPKNIKKKNQT